MGRLFEQYRDVRTVEGTYGPASGLDSMSEVGQLAKLGCVEIGDVEEVAA